jgi:hypothetical protein
MKVRMIYENMDKTTKLTESAKYLVEIAMKLII